ncbi:F-box/WD repeat-containing protein pof1 [Liparis tanakae]|uniref:F-box/WD repeat-containing protein pof1 n=1 Tax=Liparis tanakae TaxID=230148 RepID=A0A4Z2IUP1_9TELE|nr:F-box/WD repeat-containing protein pof1 [Liparis tanakae]
MGEVRKLQKKLRQIGNLEIQISLTPEERFKISRKAELRSRLAELQLQLSGPEQTLGIVGDGKKEKMKRQVEDAPEALPSQMPPASKILKGEEPSKAKATPAARQRETGRGAKISGQEDRTEPAKEPRLRDESGGRSDVDAEQRQKEAEFASLKSSWEKAKFRLRLLEGHNDIVTCVVAVDNLVVSGSRDTTVKVWHVPTATEQKNLGGHSGGVTCLSAPPPEYCKRLARSLSLSDKERFILSGSADCCVKIWALSIGQCVKSLYTFNVVTALCFVPEEDGYIITGSDGGKVQAWSWHTFENCQSINAHQEAVTSIQTQGPLVFSGAADGGVSVWENRCSDRDPLRLLHHWGEEVTGCGGGSGGRLTLSPRGDRAFLAYGRAWLKILHWRTERDDRRSGVSVNRAKRWRDVHHLSFFLLHFSSSSISPVARLTALRFLASILLVALVTRPSTCNRDKSEGEEQADALSVQLSVTAQVTPTPLWAVVWGPTQPLEDETYHFLSSQETDPLHQHGNHQEASTTRSNWPASMRPREEAPLDAKDLEGVEDGGTKAEETEPEEGGHRETHMMDF